MRARCAGRCTTRRPLHATQSSVTQFACPTGCNKPVGRWCAEARARDATAALAELGTPAFGPDAEKGTVEASTGVILPGTTEPAATVELVQRTSGRHVRVKEHRAFNAEGRSWPCTRECHPRYNRAQQDFKKTVDRYTKLAGMKVGAYLLAVVRCAHDGAGRRRARRGGVAQLRWPAAPGHEPGPCHGWPIFYLQKLLRIFSP